MLYFDLAFFPIISLGKLFECIDSEDTIVIIFHVSCI